MTTKISPVVVEPGAGHVLWILGDDMTCKLDGHATGGTHTLYECIVPPGGGPPPHIHHREDETFIILDGQIEFWINGKTASVNAGGTVFGPRGVPHAFKNPTEKPAKMLVLVTPAGIEHFFEELAREVKTLPPPIEKVVAVCAKHGIEILPPKG